jgi:SP family arabinose:H+ symporter-like MFS transporter
MQQLTGINAIVTSATIIVSGIPSLEDLTNVVPLILNVAQLLATVGTVAVLTRVGRKPLTLIGNLSLAVVDIAMGILFVFQKEWAPSGIFVFVLLIIYNLIYGISLGPVVWLYVPEIVPSKVVPLATVMNWFGCSLCVIFTPIVINLNGGNPASVFFFFGGITLLFFIMNTLFMV